MNKITLTILDFAVLFFVKMNIATLLPTSSALTTAAADVSMASTYDRLAQRAIELYRIGGTGLDGRVWIGIAGGPGAGKSTLATAVAHRINSEVLQNQIQQQRGSATKAVAIPMDGYHYTRSKLAELAESDDESNGMSRRGSPWTFDAEGLIHDLSQAKAKGTAILPEYDRALSDPVPNVVKIDLSHGIIIVEGNYLLLDLLEAEIDNDNSSDGGQHRATQQPLPDSNLCVANKDLLCPVPISEEIQRWKGTADLWDETWFVSPPAFIGGENEHENNAAAERQTTVEIQTKRVIERSLRTWTDAKTKAWGGKTDLEAATKRAEYNDVRNAKLINCCRSYADLVVDSI
mmetsp:Transcript_36479/g.43969  ORF Transcript_36479/g.43969 Transcript_36479/m.43969 type:complete len:347 (-) Transcript_36479:49-1089(-)